MGIDRRNWGRGLGIRGYSFIGCILDGAPLASDRPEILGDPRLGNVAWPAGWSERQRREWRILMDMPGAEWNGGSGSLS